MNGPLGRLAGLTVDSDQRDTTRGVEKVLINEAYLEEAARLLSKDQTLDERSCFLGPDFPS